MDKRERTIYRTTLLGTVINSILIILKFLAGILGRSSAMVADAVHSLSDFITDIIVLVFVKIAGKPRDKGHEYGHGKFETLATVIIGLFLIIAGVGLMINGIDLVVKSINGTPLPRPGYLALIIATVSIISKEWLYHFTAGKGRGVDSQAVIADAWRGRSDAISS
ncbi:MAG: cation diffusion facilitator family transporter, partial [Muribaculaceae bacterium]|nr:cation diffusion facilitator family transporter [Muribaculaceae bacterium]